MVGYVLVRRLGHRLSEVAPHLGRDVATVSSLIARLSDKIEVEERLRKKINSLAKIV